MIELLSRTLENPLTLKSAHRFVLQGAINPWEKCPTLAIKN
jgi:hypothetical protein